jgi:hypothetical protein
MSDLEKLKQCFTEIGVPFIEEPIDTEDQTFKDHSGVQEFTADTCVSIEEGIGYYSFYAEFNFLNGEFVCHGVWE